MSHVRLSVLSPPPRSLPGDRLRAVTHQLYAARGVGKCDYQVAAKIAASTESHLNLIFQCNVAFDSCWKTDSRVDQTHREPYRANVTATPSRRANLCYALTSRQNAKSGHTLTHVCHCNKESYLLKEEAITDIFLL